MMLPDNPLAPRRLPLPELSRRIKAWVRDALGLEDAIPVSVTELACRDPGCPAIETVIGILRPGLPIETVRLHGGLADIARADLLAALARRP
ncbi:nitrate reductase [Prosthecomicrobium pneumaticum]|uniref:Nitrate reductase n=1 Tax=Prosthecomicrobium pneumaticum TaxID=81895 RepID=A0A7W9FQR9_9HYPH|nr:nitrate reductase [Prosthecomicrobium pneumaticum]MBB5755100.1 hypothetical protein [Prosthecomicrobium pneumaticum]